MVYCVLFSFNALLITLSFQPQAKFCLLLANVLIRRHCFKDCMGTRRFSVDSCCFSCFLVEIYLLHF